METSIKVEEKTWADKNPELAVVGMFGFAVCILIIITALAKWTNKTTHTCPNCGCIHT